MFSHQVNIMQHIFYLFAIKMLRPRFTFAEELQLLIEYNALQ